MLCQLMFAVGIYVCIRLCLFNYVISVIQEMGHTKQLEG